MEATEENETGAVDTLQNRPETQWLQIARVICYGTQNPKNVFREQGAGEAVAGVSEVAEGVAGWENLPMFRGGYMP